MTEIVVAPAAQCERTAQALFEVLGQYGRAALLTDRHYLRGAGVPEYLVIGCSGLKSVAAQPCILVLTETTLRIPSVPGGSAVLVLGRSGCGEFSVSVQLISCGLGAKDTVTLSSLEDKRPMLSVQRPMTTLSGTVIEPMELPLPRDEGTDLFDLLAAAAIVLLCDGFGKLGM